MTRRKVTFANIVIDFLDSYVGGYHWPAFNLADNSLCCGVALFMFFSRPSRRQSRMKAEAREAFPD